MNLTYTDSSSPSRKSSCKSNFEKRRQMKIFFSKGEYYEGDLDQNFTMNGEGTYTYANGDVYFGDFVNCKRTGVGEYKYADGTIYYGQWLNDMKHGIGRLLNEKENFEFLGQFQNDQPLTGVVQNELDGDGINWINGDDNQEETNDASLHDQTKEEYFISKFINEIKRKFSRLGTIRPLNKTESLKVFNRIDERRSLLEKVGNASSCTDLVSQFRIKCQNCLKSNKTINSYNNTEDCCVNLRKLTRHLSMS